MVSQPLCPWAIIGGTGTELMELTDMQIQTVQTPYGDVEVEIGCLPNSFPDGTQPSSSVAFLKRHGSAHTFPPHLINYRANMMALKQLGVRKILATAAVGSLSLDFAPGSLVLLSQFIDFTKNRPTTYYEGGSAGVLHVDMTEPYCPDLAREIRQGALLAGIHLDEDGVYICTEGPRFETPAEIRMYTIWGATLVGMTGVPEVVLARELGMCYNSVCLVTNWAAGLAGAPLTHEEVIMAGATARQQICSLIKAVLKVSQSQQFCSCPQSAAEAGRFS